MAEKKRIEISVDDESIVFRHMDDSDGSDTSDYPKITIALPDLLALSGGVAVEMKIRELHWMDKDTCTEKKAYFLMSDPEDV